MNSRRVQGDFMKSLIWGSFFKPLDSSGRESRTLFFVGCTMLLIFIGLTVLILMIS